MTLDEFLDAVDELEWKVPDNRLYWVRSRQFTTDIGSCACPILAVAIAKGVIGDGTHPNMEWRMVADRLGLSPRDAQLVVWASDLDEEAVDRGRRTDPVRGRLERALAATGGQDADEKDS